MTYLEFQHRFGSEAKAIQHFIAVRYPKGVHCFYCNSPKVYQRSDDLRFFDCNHCGVGFSVLTGTIFHKSHIDLCRWFFAIHLFLNAKKGVSGYQLQREIKVTYKTAWRMLRQIRLAMGNESDRKLFSVCVEIDETYVGGKPRKGDKKTHPTGRGTSKIPVVGIVSRTDKRVVAKVALPDKQGKKLTSAQLLKIINKAVSKKAHFITDEFSSYKALTKRGSNHSVVNHQIEFSSGNGINTNTIEGFWSNLKRGIYGIYHQVSPKHLQRYVDEFSFRYNNRENPLMFDLLLTQAVHK